MAKNVNTATNPVVEFRPEKTYMGIRIQTPFQGMFKQIDLIRVELTKWFNAQDITPSGPPILRYHVIDMKGEMDMEYGVQVESLMVGTGRIKPTSLPQGLYVSLVYTGGGLPGNKTLLDYAKANGLQLDRRDTTKGDAFASRYEAYLTDPKVEPRKTKWDIEVAIKLKDE